MFLHFSFLAAKLLFTRGICIPSCVQMHCIDNTFTLYIDLLTKGELVMNEIEKILNIEQKEKNDKFYKISKLFREVGFNIVTSVNGISFVNDTTDIKASFYVDDTLSYQGYITSDLDRHINYSISGSDKNVVKAADDFIDAFMRYIP